MLSNFSHFTPNKLACRYSSSLYRSHKSVSHHVNIKRHRSFHSTQSLRTFPHNQILSLLNEEQRSIISDPCKQIVVAAGPGTGKTFCAAAKVVDLIVNKKASADEVLVLTHGDQVAHQIQHLVDLNTKMMANSSIIKTTSSFSSLLLEDYGISDMIPFVKEDHLISLVQENRHLFDLKKYNPNKRNDLTWRDLVEHFNKLESFGVTTIEYEKLVERLLSEAHQQVTNLESLGVKTKKEKELLLQYRIDYAATHKELCEAFKVFVNLKQEKHRFSLIDKIPMATKLISQETTKNQLVDRFKYIIVDQIEDWGRLEWNLLEALAFHPRSQDERSMLFMGDDDLAIMEWAGSPKDPFHKLKKQLTNSKLMHLTINYRNEPEVLKASRNLISRNPGRLELAKGVKKTMISVSELLNANQPEQSTAGQIQRENIKRIFNNNSKNNSIDTKKEEKVFHLEFFNETEEIQGIAQLINKLQNTKESSTGTNESDSSNEHTSIGIITRFKADAVNISNQLRELGAPVPSPLVEFPEIKFLLNILKTVLEPSDSLPLYDLLCSGMFSIPGSILAKITEIHQTSQTPLKPILKAYLDSVISNNNDNNSEVSKEDQKLLRRAKKLLVLLEGIESKIGSQTMKQIVYRILKETKVLQSHRNPNSVEEAQQSANIAKFISLVDETEIKLHNTRPAYVWPTLKKICTQTPTGNEIEDVPGIIPVRTAWASKAYEYDYVIIPQCSDDRFPGRLKRNELQECLHQAAGFQIKDSEHIYQMRRVLYMTMTRARKGVIFTYHQRSPHQRSQLKISRFIPEALGIPNAKYLPEASITPNPAPSSDLSQPPRVPSKNVLKAKEENIFGGGTFSLQNQRLIPASLHGLQVFMRCPLQYYQQFHIKVPIPSTQLSVFQEAIGAVFKSIASQEVSNNTLTSFDKLRKTFDSAWEKRGINPVKNPEMYEQGMSLTETLLDSDEGYQELVKSNAPWRTKVTVTPDDVHQSPTSLELADMFQRIYKGGHVRHYLQYSEASPPDTAHLENLAKVIAWAYYKQTQRSPSAVVIEYITTRFEMKMMQFTPTAELMIQSEQYVSSLAKKMVSGHYEAVAGPKTCKKCPFHSTCPSSVAKSDL